MICASFTMWIKTTVDRIWDGLHGSIFAPFTIWNKITPVIEIAILWMVLYRILVFFEGTRAFQVLKGISYLIIAFLLSQLFGLRTLNWLLTKLFAISIIAVLIIFQEELRLGLARLGQQHLFSVALEESEMMAILDEMTSAVYKMAKSKIGCLIALERETKLKTYIESGIPIDGKISSELILSIFTPQSPLHDGGIIARGDRIVTASSLFPLSGNPNFSKIIGTRHRAALGLTEQTDAVVVMVSEETGEISIAVNGRFFSITDQGQMVALLKDLLMGQNNKKKK